MSQGFFAHLRWQILNAVWMGLIGGALIGFVLGITLVSLQKAAQILPSGGVWLCVPPLLAAVYAWGGIAILLPIALLAAGAQTIWPSLHVLRVRRLYPSALLAIAIFVFAALWMAFRVVRDVAEPSSVALFAGVALAASTLFLTLLLPWKVRHARAADAPSGTVVAAGLTLSVIVGLGAYRALVVYVPAYAASTDGAGAAPARLQVPDRPVAAPDVILVSIDTLRADHLSINGYARRTTPHLDEVAAQGANFVNAHSQAPWTLPSHAAMMVGRYPSSCGVLFGQFFRFLGRAEANRLASSNVTLAEILRANGFRTAAFTSSDYLTARFGFDQGFEQVEQADPLAVDHAATVIEKGIGWLAADTSRPAFLFLHLYSVHQYSSPEVYDTLYQDPNYRGPLKGRPLRTVTNPSPTDADVQYVMAKYDGALRYVDDQLGRLFTWLRDQRRYDHTLLVITSDHGEEFRDHGAGGHGFTLYEEQLHVPLIIKPPQAFTVRRPQPRVLAGVIDIVPTVLDYLGLPSQPMTEGMSLRPAIETGAQFDRTLFAEGAFFFNSYAIIGSTYKFIDNRVPPLDFLNVGLVLANVRSFYKFRENELYQLERDPHERANLVRLDADAATQMDQNLLAHIRTIRLGKTMVLDTATRERLRALGYAN